MKDASMTNKILMTCFLLALTGACGDDGGDASSSEAAVTSATCTALSSCDFFTTQAECEGFYAQVFVDLDERCNDPGPVKEAYIDSLNCVAEEGCAAIDGTVCGALYDEYDALKEADGPECQPDDD